MGWKEKIKQKIAEAERERKADKAAYELSKKKARAEYRREREKAIIERAKKQGKAWKPASERAYEYLSAAAKGTQSPRKTTKTKSQKTKYVIIGGKAVPLAQQKRTRTPKKQKQKGFGNYNTQNYNLF